MRIAPVSVSFTVLLGVLAGLPALSIDLSAPTLVLLPTALSTTVMVAGLTLSLFMLGFAVGQLAGGRVSDRLGRRPVLLAALIVYTASGAACALAMSGPELAAARFVQGAGAGACAVLAFAMVQDLFEGEAARIRRSYVTVVLGIMPMLAPAIGAGLDSWLGWRSVHTVLAVAGLMLLGVVALCLDESRPAVSAPPHRHHLAPKLREDGGFLQISLINALSYGTLFAYIAGAPVVIIGQMKLGSGVYALVFAGTALALSMGALASARLGKRNVSAAQLAWPGLMLQTVSALGLAIGGVHSSHWATLALGLLAVGCFGRGLAAPNLNHLALAHRHHDAGMASAVYGLFQLVGGAAASAAVAALLPQLHGTAVTAPMALLASGAAVMWLLATRRARRCLAVKESGPTGP